MNGISFKENCLLNSSNLVSKFLCGDRWQQTQINWVILEAFFILTTFLLPYIWRRKYQTDFLEYFKRLSPSFSKLLIFAVSWIGLEMIFPIFFGVCIYGDCVGVSGFGPCCGKLRTSVAETLFNLKRLFFFPLISYILAAHLGQTEETQKKAI